MGKLLVAILAVTFLSACSNQPGKTAVENDFNPADIKAIIDSANKLYGERFTTNDTAYYASRYCRDAVIMPEQSPPLAGRDAIRNFNYNDGKNKDFRVVITATAVYGGPSAVIEEGYYAFPGADGEIYDKGKFIAVWKQEDGKWKLYREIWNTDNARRPR